MTKFTEYVWLYRGMHHGDNDGDQRPEVFADRETAKLYLYQQAKRFQKHFIEWHDPEEVNLEIETPVDRDDYVKVWCYDYTGIVVRMPVIESIEMIEEV